LFKRPYKPMNRTYKFLLCLMCLSTAPLMARTYDMPADSERVQVQPLTPEQKLRADRLISIFENSTMTLQYGYIEDIKDGRGYTAGRVGFCSATGDLLMVVERYTQDRPSNILAKYLPRLHELASHADPSTAGIEGLKADWPKAAQDPAMRAAQDFVADRLYYRPALQMAAKLGLRSPLARVALYEAGIQHGYGDDPDGMAAMAHRATTAAGGTPASGISESAWLLHFLEIRKSVLAHASNPDTQAGWAESQERADVMLRIFKSGNMDFNGPIPIDVYGDHYTLRSPHHLRPVRCMLP